MYVVGVCSLIDKWCLFHLLTLSQMIPTESPMHTATLAAMTTRGWRAQKVPQRVNAFTMPSSNLTPAMVRRLNFSKMVWLRE